MVNILGNRIRRRLRASHVFALILAAVSFGSVLADDIVTMPTANTLKKGEVDVAVYYLDLDLPDGAPRFAQYQTVYIGLTDRLELDVHRQRVDRDDTAVVLVGSYKLLSEGPDQPDLVVGVRNFAGEATTKNPALRDKSDNPSVYLTAARTFFRNPEKPGPPLVRAHLGIGTADWTLLGEKRHQGAFGGLQFLLTPFLGGVAQYDGQDIITGLTLMPFGSWLTLKGGTYGSHAWYGIALRRDF